MRFGILGPLEVWDDGRRVAVGGPQQRALLAVLLLEANRVTSAERLVAHLWGEQPPATARSLLQGCVAGLRRALRSDIEPDRQRLVTQTPGYLLRVEPGELDADQFEDLVAAAAAAHPDHAARPEDARTGLARASELLSGALSLWRGPALAELSSDACRAAAARLEERRLAVLEERIDLDLRLGRHAELIAELQAHVRNHPLRERMWSQLMLALYRADRRADALTAYQGLRQMLVEQLGVEPGSTVQRVHRAILAGAAVDEPEPPAAPVDLSAGAADPSWVVPAQLPAPTSTFIGRDEELKLLDELLTESPGGLAVGVISGTAGVGKTALAVHWAYRVRERFTDGQLYVNLGGGAGGAAVAAAEAAMRGFLDALGVAPERVPVGLPERVSQYRSLLADRRVLVVLDNAADAEQVRPLLPGSPGALVLVTSRNQLAGLVAAEGARPVSLELLTGDEARQLLCRRLGSGRVAAEPDAVERIIARCAGLPLALAIAAARAAAQPGFPLAVLADGLGEPHGDLPPARLRHAPPPPDGLAPFTSDDPMTDLREVFSWSYRALGGESARLFRLLSLHPGPDIGVAAVASLAGCPAAQVRAWLAELVRANLLIEHQIGRYAFHDLLRAYAGEQVSAIDSDAERDAATHRILDHYLHTAYAADRLLFAFRDPIDLAAPRPGVAPETFPGGRAAMAWFDAELAVLLAAVYYAAASGRDTHTWQLARVIAGALDQRVRWSEWAAAQRAALAATQRLADRSAEALTRCLLGYAYAYLGQHDDSEAQLRQGVDLYRELGDHTGEARAHHAIARSLEQQGRLTEALHHTERALETHRIDGNERGQAAALNNVCMYLMLLGEHRRALTYGVDALALFERFGDRLSQGDAWESLGHAHHHLAEHREALDCYQHALVLYREHGDQGREAETLSSLGDTYQADGHPGRARGVWQKALNILDELGHPQADEVRAKLRDRA